MLRSYALYDGRIDFRRPNAGSMHLHLRLRQCYCKVLVYRSAGPCRYDMKAEQLTWEEQETWTNALGRSIGSINRALGVKTTLSNSWSCPHPAPPRSLHAFCQIAKCGEQSEKCVKEMYLFCSHPPSIFT
jgi:hypothetical protein